MTTVSTIIRDAYRQSNLISISADPTAAEIAEALRLLNRFVSSLYGNEAGEQLKDLPLGRNNISAPSGFPYYDNAPSSDFVLPMNVRGVLNLTSPLTVYLHPMPKDGARFAFIDKSGNLATHNLTLDANGRTIEGSTQLVINTDNDERKYFYRADTGNWVKVSPLIEADESPFPSEFDDLFVIGLAIRLNPRHQAELDPQSGSVFASLLKQFKTRYRQSEEVASELGLLRTVAVKRGTLSSDDAFTRGYPFPRA